MHTGFWGGNLRERENLEDLSVWWRIILKYIFKKCDGGVACITVVEDRERRCECCNETSGSIEYGHFLD